jgi:hypothetical protein
MSLINDALKQARQSLPQNPPAGPPPPAPIESAARGGMSWLAPVMIILFLAAAGIFIGLSLSKPVPLVAATRPVAPVPPAPQPVAVVTNAAVAVSNTVVAAAPPKPPEPKLQGILFDATRPCAIVSGRTVHVGDFAGGLRVAAISQNSITLQNETETNVLSLNR